MDVWCAIDCELGEGARWVDGRLVFVDILAGRLLTVSADHPGTPEELFRLDVPLGAVAPVQGTPGLWLAAAGQGFALLDERDGSVKWIDRPVPSTSRMNDAVCDPAGRMWAGAMPYDSTPGAGVLYRVGHDLTVTPVRTGLTIPNGPAFTADGRTMYLADSAEGRIDRRDVDPATGDLGAPYRLRHDRGRRPRRHDRRRGRPPLGRRHGAAPTCAATRPTGGSTGSWTCRRPSPRASASTDGRLFVTSAAHGLSPAPATAGSAFAGRRPVRRAAGSFLRSVRLGYLKCSGVGATSL